MTRILTHERRQHAVGQGFFHSGSVSVGDSTLRYVYDCGSEQTHSLRTSVRCFCEELNDDHVDVLFISHLHDDHVAGLDTLLSLTTANIVVLPYLGPVELLLAVSRAVADGTLSGTFIDAISDPASWFSERGAQTIIYMSDQRSADAPTSETTADQFRTDLDSTEVSVYLDRIRRNAATLAGGRRVRAEILRSYHADDLPLRYRGAVLAWLFRTYVHRESDETLKIFADRVAEMLKEVRPTRLAVNANPKLSRSSLTRLLQSAKSRRKLRHAYASIQKDLNKTSMSLYSGPPVHTMDGHWSYWTGVPPTQNSWASGPVGWLGTGDADLADDQRRLKFLDHFRQQHHAVSTLAVPHHGSRYNFHVQLLDTLAPSLVTVAAGQSNRHGHPHKSVLCEIIRRKMGTFVTTEKPQSEVWEMAQCMV